jgi:hypothetical protein
MPALVNPCISTEGEFLSIPRKKILHGSIQLYTYLSILSLRKEQRSRVYVNRVLRILS